MGQADVKFRQGPTMRRQLARSSGQQHQAWPGDSDPGGPTNITQYMTGTFDYLQNFMLNECSINSQ